MLFLLHILISKSPVRVIARERSDRSNLTVFRSVKYGGIAALPLVARNDEGLFPIFKLPEKPWQVKSR